MDLSDILAFIAIIVSIIVYFRGERINKGINKHNSNQKFFEKIYFDYMIHKIPSAWNQFDQSSGLLEEPGDNLNKVINEMLDQSLFYKFFNRTFYNDLSKILIELDDLLVDSGNHKGDKLIYQDYKDRVNGLINKLYSKLKEQYSDLRDI